MTLTTDQVRALVEKGIPGAAVQVHDLTGTSDHFQVRVEATAFAGKSLIEQHKMVHAALGQYLTREIHAVDIKTSVPA
jgi:stress-induced morphogen